MDYRVILFDVGGTLIESTRPLMTRLAEAAGPSVKATDLHEALATILAATEYPDGPVTIDESRLAWLEAYIAALRLTGYESDVDRAAQRMWEALVLSGMRLFPEVRSVLTRLVRHGIRLGVVSNWPATLDLTLEAMGIAPYFEVSICSALVGVRKPNPEIFALAARAMDADPAYCAYVGDDYDLDVIGATAAGMAPILVSRSGGGHIPHVRQSIRVIRSLADLVA